MMRASGWILAVAIVAAGCLGPPTGMTLDELLATPAGQIMDYPNGEMRIRSERERDSTIEGNTAAVAFHVIGTDDTREMVEEYYRSNLTELGWEELVGCVKGRSALDGDYLCFDSGQLELTVTFFDPDQELALRHDVYRETAETYPVFFEVLLRGDI